MGLSNTSPEGFSSALPFALSQSAGNSKLAHRKLAGFAKVLAGGRVVGLQKEKPFPDRMLANGISNFDPKLNSPGVSVEQVILESVATNLEAGVKLLDKQEFALAKMGGRLSEMALSLNLARQNPDHAASAQITFEHSLATFRSLSKETFDHTALFSIGPAKPVTVAVPAHSYWEGLSIDRCNLSSPGIRAVNSGKVSPSSTGLLLDPQTFTKAFAEWRELCAVNRLQWHLIYDRWRSITTTLKHLLGGRRWNAPPFPDDLRGEHLLRPHKYN